MAQRDRAYVASAVVLAVLLPAMLALAGRQQSEAADTPPAVGNLYLAIADGARRRPTPRIVPASLLRAVVASLPADGSRAWLAGIIDAELGGKNAMPAWRAEEPVWVSVAYRGVSADEASADLDDAIARDVPYPHLALRVRARARRLVQDGAGAEALEGQADREGYVALQRLTILSSYFAFLLLVGLAVLAVALLRRPSPAASIAVRWQDGAGVCALWLALHLTTSAVFSGLLAMLGLHDLIVPILATTYATNGIVAIVLAQRLMARPARTTLLRLILGPRPASAPFLAAAGVAAAVPLLLAAYGLGQLLHVGGGTSQNPALRLLIEGGTIARALLGLLAVVAAPIVEETVFRGALYPALRERLASLPAMLLCGGLFAASHMDFPAFLPLLSLGALLSYLRERTGALLPSMLTHAIWNLQTLGIVLYLFGPS